MSKPDALAVRDAGGEPSGRPPAPALRSAIAWSDWRRSLGAGAAAVFLFVAAVWLTRHYEATVYEVLTRHAWLALGLFFLTSVTAVLMPVMSNLALVPAFVLVWGPGRTALVLLAGWIVGAALSFILGRHVRSLILRVFPSVGRHADIDRLIHPRHRMLSLIMLRMTFPVDVLSYALGLFSVRTTLVENLVSTTVGAAPFAILFTVLPVLSATAQALVFVGSAVMFGVYAFWILGRSNGG